MHLVAMVKTSKAGSLRRDRDKEAELLQEIQYQSLLLFLSLESYFNDVIPYRKLPLILHRDITEPQQARGLENRIDGDNAAGGGLCFGNWRYFLSPLSLSGTKIICRQDAARRFGTQNPGGQF